MRFPVIAAIRLRTLFLFVSLPFLMTAWWIAVPHLISVPALAPTESVSGKLVVIDPGHGGRDPGAVGRSGLLEKDVVLAVAQALEPMLNRVAVYTLMVREGDYDLATDSGTGTRKREDLNERVRMANEAGADLFVSLHANSFPSAQWSGAQTFYYPGKEDGRILAEAIQARLIEAFPENTRRARPGEYFVLRETTMPAVVVEVGFLSNPREEELLGTREHRERIARAVYRGIVDYLVGDVDGVPQRETTGLSEDRWAPVLSLTVGDDEFLVFFDSPTGSLSGLAAVVVPFPDELAAAPRIERMEYALRAQISGPRAGSTLLPTLPQETRVLELKVTGETAEVDFSREVRTRFWGGGRSEELLIESVVRTLGQFEGIREVILRVEGDGEGTLAGHVDIGAPFLVPLPTGRP